MRQDRPDRLALAHLVVGVAMTLLVVLVRPLQGDPGVFMKIGNESAGGLVAYRDYAVEYPPLALVPIDLPRLLGGDSTEAYNLIFTLISLLLTLGTGAAVYWLARRRWSIETPVNAMMLFTGLALAGAPLVLWRFDILPTFLTTLALVAYAARQPVWSGLVLGFGVVSKLYPGVLVPVFAVAKLFERNVRQAALVIGGAAIAVLVVMAETFLVAGNAAFSFLTYQQDRGVEIESVSGGIALLMSVLGQARATIGWGFGSWQVSSPIIGSLAVPQLVLNAILISGLLVAGWISFNRDVRNFGRIQPATLIRYSLATLLVLILVDKVLSPQYLVWLLPFAALLQARQSVLLLAVVALTTLVYPLSFGSLVSIDPAAVLVLNLRNILLLGYFAWTVWPAQAPAPWPDVAPDSERGYVREPAK